MSHIVTIQTEVHDPEAIRLACGRLQWPAPTYGPAALFTQTVNGWRLQLPGWTYPVVCNVERREVLFDNYEGLWGDRAHLNRFLQAYAVEKARLEARKQGYSTVEQQLENGSIKVTVYAGA